VCRSTIDLARPAIALLVWVSIGCSLASLYSVSKEIDMGDASNLDPVKMRDKPNKLHPMIDALSSLLLPIQRSIEKLNLRRTLLTN
jgi:two-component system sensor histidine kinase QseC